MLTIQGQLANYEIISSAQMYILLDVDTKSIYTRNKVIYVSFVSYDLYPVTKQELKRRKSQSPDQQIQIDKNIEQPSVASLIFQIDLSKYLTLDYSIAKFNNNPRVYLDTVLMNLWNNVRQMPKNDPEFTVYGESALLKPKELCIKPKKVNKVARISDISDWTDNEMTLVEERYGFPDDFNTHWANINDYLEITLSGGSVYDAIAAMAKVNAGTVRQVLNGLGSLLINTALHSGKMGVTAMDFIVPPLGTFKVRVAKRDRTLNPIKVSLDVAHNIVSSITEALQSDTSTPSPRATNMRVKDRIKARKRELKENNGRYLEDGNESTTEKSDSCI